MIKEILQIIFNFITHRLFILAVIITLMFYILMNRLFTLQIIQGEEHLNNFINNKISRERDIGTTRGNIYDRYGRPLAMNTLAYSITIDDSFDIIDKNHMIYELITIIEGNGDKVIKEVPIIINERNEIVFNGSVNQINRFKRDIFSTKTLSDEQENMSAIQMFEYMRDKRFKIDPEKYTEEEILKIMGVRFALFMKGHYQYKGEVIAINVNEKTLAHIRENSNKFPGVSIIQAPLRYYPDGEYFSHIIGYTGLIQQDQIEELRLQDESYTAADIVGRQGIEKAMEIYLRGQKGKERVFVDSLGKTLEVTEREDPLAGKDIFLTIDKELQIDTYNALEKQIAQILYDRIKKTKTEDFDYLFEDIIIALINNNIIDISSISESNDALHQEIFREYLSREEIIINKINQQLTNNTQIINSLDIELQDFIEYIYKTLIYNDILNITNEIINEDEVFKDFRAGNISFMTFLTHAIAEDYLDLTKLGLDDSYYDYEEIYNKLTDYILEYLEYNKGFKTRVYESLINSNSVSKKDWILLLYNQEILQDDSRKQDLITNDISPLDLIKEKIINLEITPKQLALEPSEGSAVVTDVNNGEVLALVSYPSFDNNKLVNDLDLEYYDKLNSDLSEPLIHRALKQRIAPGSTFKMVSAIAGLTEEVIQPNEIINSEGIYTKISPAVKCWIYGSGTHGRLKVIEALAVSCNFFFNEVGYRLSMNEGRYVSTRGTFILTNYASMFGLDQKTGIEISEYAPQISDQDAVRSAIGQGQHNYTTAHLARYIATLANGGYVYNLNIIDKIMDSDKSLFTDIDGELAKRSDFNQEYLKIVQEGMYNVTNGSTGTARSIFNNFPISVAGKSGTAQQSRNSPNHSLFVGYAPYEEPEISIAVTIPHGITGGNSARVMKDIIASYFELYTTNEELSYDNTLY